MIMSIPMFMVLVPVFRIFFRHPQNHTASYKNISLRLHFVTLYFTNMLPEKFARLFEVYYRTLCQYLEVIGSNGIRGALTSDVCKSAMYLLLAVPIKA